MDEKMMQDLAGVKRFEFFPAEGESPDFAAQVKGSTLVYPTLSAGMGPAMAVDLFILNENAKKLGYIKCDYISPLIANDALSLDGQEDGSLQLPCTLFQSADKRFTFFILRSGVVSGKMKEFGLALAEFIVKGGFSRITILSSTLSPVKRGRDTNKQIPEVYGYVNNHLY